MKKWIILLLFFIIIATIIWTPTSPSQLQLNKIESELIKYKTEFSNTKYAIVIDYNKPVFRKILWVIELKTKKIILNSHVSHAFKSGIIWATDFSNKIGSNESSQGVFKTLNSYPSTFGDEGMRLKGLEKNINNNVLIRNIVFHRSYSPWSSGCFMTCPSTNKQIIRLTKNGSILIVN